MLQIQNNLKKIRHLSGLTQLQMGFQIGATKDQIHAWESGRSLPNPNYLELIAGFASVSEEELGSKELQYEDITIVLRKTVEGGYGASASTVDYREKYIALLEDRLQEINLNEVRKEIEANKGLLQEVFVQIELHRKATEVLGDKGTSEGVSPNDTSKKRKRPSGNK